MKATAKLNISLESIVEISISLNYAEAAKLLEQVKNSDDRHYHPISEVLFLLTQTLGTITAKAETPVQLL